MDHEQTTLTYTTADRRNGPRRRIAFIQACWHRDIVDRCREGFLATWKEKGGDPDEVEIFEVPGSFEIPLLAQHLTASGRWDAVVAAGFVVDGGIYRHEFVAETVIAALMRVQLDSQVPVISAVLTPHAFHEHDVHRGFFGEHFVVKGREAAIACRATVDLLDRVKTAA
jgi:6,7-dimethyl-8-ribityllumazine synthase